VTPDHPCPRCGHDHWKEDAHTGPDSLTPVTCAHCHILMTPHWVDGAWMGAFWYSKYPGSLTEFVAEHSEYLRGTR